MPFYHFKKIFLLFILSVMVLPFSLALGQSAGSVALVWESDSYTPPFYKGKALIGSQSQVRLIATPQFAGKTENDYFTWTRNGRVLGSQSGYGKNTLDLTAPLAGSSISINVTASSPDGATQGSNSVIIQPVQPKLVVYLYSPVYGTLYNRVINADFKMTSKESSFSAVPYFVNLTGQSSQALDYMWVMNGRRIDSANSSVMTLRNDASTTGQTTIAVSANDRSLNKTNQKQFSVSY